MNAYLWLKAFHVIAVMSWMAGLLYLPRLMVYHCDAEPGGKQSETFKLMERRLLNAIMTPAMVVSLALGIATGWLSGASYLFSSGWFWAKLVMVGCLFGVHFLLAVHVRQFALDQNSKPARYYRWINEVPTVLMIGIVILVTVKPF